MKRTIALLLVLATAVAGASAQDFAKSKVLDSLGKHHKVDLTLEADSKVIRVDDPQRGATEVAFTSIQKLSYEPKKHHRIKAGLIVAMASLGAGAIVMLTRSTDHWLHVDYQDAAGQPTELTLKLDKGEYKDVIAALETATGKEVAFVR